MVKQTIKKHKRNEKFRFVNAGGYFESNDMTYMKIAGSSDVNNAVRFEVFGGTVVTLDPELQVTPLTLEEIVFSEK